MIFIENVQKHYYRPTINTKFKNILKYPLTVISAHFASGKTIAINQFIENYDIPYIYISVLPSSDEARTYNFYTQFLESLAKKFPELSSISNKEDFLSDPNTQEQIFDILSSYKNKGELIIIIDDYHNAENDKLNLFMTNLANIEPPHVHFVIISRSMPKIPVEELVIKNLCCYIGQEIFYFSREEMFDYFKFIQFDAPDNIKDDIVDLSSGWIAAAYLLAVQYDSTHEIKDYTAIFNMFKYSLFNMLEPDEKKILAQLSWLLPLEYDRIAYIFEDKKPLDLVDSLYQNNLFIYKNGNQYYFQQLFQKFLEKKRLSMKLDMSGLFVRLAESYINDGFYRTALALLYRAGNFDKFLNTIELPDVDIYSVESQMLFTVFGLIPPEYKFKYPIATLKMLLLKSLAGETQFVEATLDELKEYFSVHAHPVYPINKIIAEMDMVKITYCSQDLNKMLTLTRDAESKMDNTKSIIRTSKSVVTYGEPHFTFFFFNKVGEYKEIVQKLHESFNRHARITDGCGAGCNFLALAEYYLETGQFDHVENNAVKAIYAAADNGQTCVIASARMSLGRLYILQQQKAKLETILDKLKEMLVGETNNINLVTIYRALSYLYVCSGQLDKIPKELYVSDVSSFYSATFTFSILYREALMKQDWLMLEILVDKYHNDVLKAHTILALISNYMFGAIAQYKQGNPEGSYNALQKALDYAVADNVVTPFLEAAPYVAPILESHTFEAPQEFVDRILNAVSSATACEKTMKSNGLLSNREEEILSLLYMGKSKKEIAAELFISENTVKRHVQNIYRKLNVSNKTLALNAYKAFCQ